MFEKKPELLDKYGSKAEIKRKTRQFEYREIISYLRAQLGPEGMGVIEAIIPEYSELSSYVHGGPHTIAYQEKIRVTRFEEYKGMVRFVVNMYKQNAVMVYACIAHFCDDKKMYAVSEELAAIPLVE